MRIYPLATAQLLLLLVLGLPYVNLALTPTDVSIFVLPAAFMLAGTVAPLRAAAALVLVLPWLMSDQFVQKTAASVVLFLCACIAARRTYELLSLPVLAIFAAAYTLGAAVSLLAPDLLQHLMFRVGTDEARGLTSLAPEPAMFGVLMAAFAALCFEKAREETAALNLPAWSFSGHQLLFLLFALLCLLSLSLWGLLVLASYIGLRTGIITLVVALVLGVCLLSIASPDLRVVQLLQLGSGLHEDASVAARLDGIVAGWSGMLDIRNALALAFSYAKSDTFFAETAARYNMTRSNLAGLALWFACFGPFVFLFLVYGALCAGVRFSLARLVGAAAVFGSVFLNGQFFLPITVAAFFATVGFRPPAWGEAPDAAFEPYPPAVVLPPGR